MHARPAARTEGLLIESLGDELLVYDTERGKAHSLNAVAAAIWEVCDGERGIEELGDAATEKLGDPVSPDAVWRALSQLDERRLLVGELPARMSGPEFSRRSALARAGLIGASAAFAAPLVKSIVMPDASQAGFQQSCVPENGQCGTDAGGGCDTSQFPPCCPAADISCRSDPSTETCRCLPPLD